MLPELEVLDFFVEGHLTELHLMLKADNLIEVAHFFDIPAVVIGFA